VADIDHAIAAIDEPAQRIEQPRDLGLRQTRGRLVENQELGFDSEGTGDGDDGSVGPRQSRDTGIRIDVAAEELERPLRYSPHPPPVDERAAPRVAIDQGNVFRHGHPTDEPQFLMDESDRRFGVIAGERPAVERDLATIRLVNTGEHLDQSGLAGPIGAKQGMNLASLDIEVDVVDGQRATELLDQAAHAQQWRSLEGG
jgi:hypothetical protein